MIRLLAARISLWWTIFKLIRERKRLAKEQHEFKLGLATRCKDDAGELGIAARDFLARHKT